MQIELPRVDVIVPAYKSGKTIQLCIDAILAQSYPEELLNIILVDNDPSGNLSHLAGERIRVIKEDRVGSYSARNAGILASSADVLAFTDADCRPHRTWIAAALAHMRATSTKRLAGRIEQRPISDKPKAVECYQLALSFDQERLALQGLAVTANMFATKDLFCVVGKFNERLLTGGDWEWNRRATKLGYEISYCEQAIVEHPTRSSWEDVLKKTRRVNSRKERKNIERLFILILLPFYIGFALLPPIAKGLRIYGSSNLGSREKFMAWMVAYILKPYGKMYFVLTSLGILKPSRA